MPFKFNPFTDKLDITSTSQPGLATITTPDAVVVAPVNGNINFLDSGSITITGSGNDVTFAVSGGSSFTWNVVSSTSPVTMAKNNGYILNTTAVNLTLPATAAVGDTIIIYNYNGTDGVVLAGVNSTIITAGNNQFTGIAAGGTVLTTTLQSDAVTLTCSATNTTWNVSSSQGTWKVGSGGGAYYANSLYIGESGNGLVSFYNGGFSNTNPTHHGVCIGGVDGGVNFSSVGATGTVLIGNTGADPTFSASPVVTGLTASTITTASGALTVTGRPLNVAIIAALTAPTGADPALVVTDYSATLPVSLVLQNTYGTPESSSQTGVFFCGQDDTNGYATLVGQGTGASGQNGELIVSTSISNTLTQACIFKSGGLSFDGTNVLANFVDVTSWTPTISSSGGGTTTYAIQFGVYSRIGNLVIAQFYVQWTGQTGSGNLRLASLPFTVYNSSFYLGPGCYAGNVALAASCTAASSIAIENTTYAQFTCYGSGFIGAMPLATSGTIEGSIIYYV